MKQTLLLLFIFSFTLSVTDAQTFSYKVDQPDSTFVLNEGVFQDIVIKDFVDNLLAADNDLVWRKRDVSMPIGWTSAVCDKNACYSETTFTRGFTMDPNETGTMDLHLYTNRVGMEGDVGVVEVCVYEEGDTTTMQCQEYTFSSQLSSTQNQNQIEAELHLAPNPAVNYFEVKTESKIGNVEVYNIIGAKVRTFNADNDGSYDVADLSSGIYLVRVYDQSNSRVLSTLRLKKR